MFVVLVIRMAGAENIESFPGNSMRFGIGGRITVGDSGGKAHMFVVLVGVAVGADNVGAIPVETRGPGRRGGVAIDDCAGETAVVKMDVVVVVGTFEVGAIPAQAPRVCNERRTIAASDGRGKASMFIMLSCPYIST